MERIEVELQSMTGNNPSEMMSSNSIEFLPDNNRIVFCCSSNIFMIVLCLDHNSLSKSGRQDFLKIEHCHLFNTDNLPMFTFSEGIVDHAAFISKLSVEDAHTLTMDHHLSKYVFYPRCKLGGFRSIKPSPCQDEMLLSVVTFECLAFIAVERQGWQILIHLHEVIKNHVVNTIDTPVPVEGLSFAKYKNIIWSMCCVEMVWSQVFKSLNGKVKSEWIFLFCGMKNGDVHLMRISLPLKSRDDVTLMKTESCQSEISALSYQAQPGDCGYLFIGTQSGNVQVLEVHQDSKSHSLHNSCFEDLIPIKNFSFLKAYSFTLLLAAKGHFVLCYIFGENGIEFVKSLHLNSSLPVKSIITEDKKLFVFTEDGFKFAYNVRMTSNEEIDFHLINEGKCVKTLGAKPVWPRCRGVAVSSNKFLSLVVDESKTCSIDLSKNSSHSFSQRISLSCPTSFDVEQFIEDVTHGHTQSIMNTQDASLFICLYFQHVIRSGNNLSLVQCKTILDKLHGCDNFAVMQITRTLLYHLTFKLHLLQGEKECLRLEELSNLEELGNKIILKHILGCFSLAKEQKLEAIDLEILSAMLKWIKFFAKESIETMNFDETEILLNEKEPTLTLKCYVCQEDIKSYGGLLSVTCGKGHKANLSCLSLRPVGGFNVRTCISCGMSAEELEVLASTSVLRKDMPCTLCGGLLSC